jgi:hypothetical protein
LADCDIAFRLPPFALVLGIGMSLLKIALSLVMAVGVSACQTGGYVPGGDTVSWQKKGTTRAQRHEDRLTCEVAGAQAVPVATQTAYSGGYSNPGTLQCTSVGYSTSCNRVGAYSVPSSMSTYDSNSSLRNNFVELCMTKKGYSIQPTKWCQNQNDLTTENCVVPRY